MLTFLDSEDLREDTTWTILKMNGKQKEKRLTIKEKKNKEPF